MTVKSPYLSLIVSIASAANFRLNDTVARDRIYTTLALLRKMRQSLEHYVEEGKMARDELAKFLELEKKGFIGRLLTNV